MTHPVITISNEVVTAINGETYTPAVVAAKAYHKETERQQATTATVTVKPDLSFHERRLISRGQAAEELFEVVIIVESPVNPASTSAVETLLNLLDAIAATLRTATYTCGTLVTNPEDPRAADIQLDENNYFLAAIRLRFKLIRS